MPSKLISNLQKKDNHSSTIAGLNPLLFKVSRYKNMLLARIVIQTAGIVNFILLHLYLYSTGSMLERLLLFLPAASSYLQHHPWSLESTYIYCICFFSFTKRENTSNMTRTRTTSGSALDKEIYFFSTSVPLHSPELDGFDWHFEASVHFTQTSAINKSKHHWKFREIFLGMPGIKPGAAGSWSKYANHCAMLFPTPLSNKEFF